MPAYEDKSTREYIQGVALKVAKGEQSPEVYKKKKLFPESYGMALGTHGVGHYLKTR